MGLPEGNYLMSNICDNYGCPVYENSVAPHGLRIQQWQKLKKVGANGRTIRIFRNKSDYVRYMDSIGREER